MANTGKRKENRRDQGSIKWSQGASTETRSVEALCSWLVGCWERDVDANAPRCQGDFSNDCGHVSQHHDRLLLVCQQH